MASNLSSPFPHNSGTSQQSFQPLVNVDEERLRIDSQVAELDLRISELTLAREVLKKRRNLLAPVSRLPEDILRNVFKELQIRLNADEENAMHLESQIPQVLWNQAVTHVCSLWRDLALNTPTLWTRILLGDISVASEMLVRSRFALLSITIPGPRSSVPRAELHTIQEVLQSHVHRAKALDFHLPYSWYDASTLSILQAKVSPNTLESCSFNVGILPVAIPRVDLPIEVLVKSVSSLRHLELDFCIFPLKATNTRIVFKRLSTLLIKSLTEDCADFLDHISIPRMCSVTIIAWGKTMDFSSLDSFVRGFWETPDRALHSVSICPPPADTYGGALQLILTNANTNLGSLTIRIGMIPRSADITTRSFVDFLSLVPLHSLTALTVHTTLEAPFWNLISNSCREITRISLTFRDRESPDMNPFFDVLHVRDQVPVLETEEDGLILDPSIGEVARAMIPIRLPKLEHITFSSMQLSEEQFELLKRSLVIRQLVDRQLHSIALKNVVGGVHRDEVHGLTQYVKDGVDWSFDLFGKKG